MSESSPRLRPALVLGAIGVVFGDIGTSPLYTLHECLTGQHGAAPTRENIFGVVSLILWAVTLVVTIKYLAFLMRADNEGEGGIMALLALVPKRLRTPKAGHISIVALLVVGGAALLFGDGIITPAISVLSAMEGLEVATKRLVPVIVPATVVILFLLFLVQQRGTGGLGKLFGPVMIAWFLMLGTLGVMHILRRPVILGAFSPIHGVRFFAHNGWRGFRVLGGVVLAVTGGEALYADMGHFGRGPIRAAWLALVYPCLLLCYLGQGAMLLDHPAGVAQPLYSMVPDGWLIYPAVALAAAATIIASQALISGVFSLTHQAIRLGYFPRVTIRHTSRDAEGQIYVPLMNWGLAVACIALVLVFRESAKMAAAYGLAVSGTMLITSIVFFVVIRDTWKWSLWASVSLLIFFLLFDIPFLVANALKFLDGGYLPFLVGVFFVIIMVIWHRGRGLAMAHLSALSEPEARFLECLDQRVQRLPGTAVFMASSVTGIPSGMQQLVQRFSVLHEKALVLNVTSEHVPHIAKESRVQTADIGKGIFRITLRYGFMDTPNIPEELNRTLAPIGCDQKITELLYVLGRETFTATSSNEMGAVAESLFALLARNAKNATEAFGIPPEQVVEIGMHVDL